MLWNKARPSDNVNDTREGKDARTFTGKALGSGLAAAALLGAGLYASLGTTPDNAPANHEQLPQFVQSVLGDTEDTWTQLFAQTGRHYPAPTLTLYSHEVMSGCGFATAGSGPFYCPDDQRIYLDPAFFSQLAPPRSTLREFAQAYVIAHEIGHHVQLELGLSEPLDNALAEGQPVMGERGLEVRAELQADCLAGVWAHHAQQRLNWLEPGDIDAALNLATVLGDDYQQRTRQGAIRPETFSHGTSAQRVNWFKSGFASGRMETCDTFASADL